MIIWNYLYGEMVIWYSDLNISIFFYGGMVQWFLYRFTNIATVQWRFICFESHFY